jgi:hypothetical protein
VGKKTKTNKPKTRPEDVHRRKEADPTYEVPLRDQKEAVLPLSLPPVPLFPPLTLCEHPLKDCHICLVVSEPPSSQKS